MNISRSFETTLLRRTFLVIRLAHCVVLWTFYDRLLPLTVMQIRWFLDLLGLIDTTIRPYVTLLHSGTAYLCMKKIMFVPLVWFPTPWANLPMSLDNDVVQVHLLGPGMSCVYPWVFSCGGVNHSLGNDGASTYILQRMLGPCAWAQGLPVGRFDPWIGGILSFLELLKRLSTEVAAMGGGGG